MKNLSNEEMIIALNKRLDMLRQQVELIKQSISGSETGRLRVVAPVKRKTRYYYSVGDAKEREIKDISVARQLAQIDYYRKVLPVLEKECNAIEQILMTNSKDRLVQIYGRMTPQRQELLSPIVMTEEQRKSKFLSREYISQPFPGDEEVEYYSRNGLKVRSKSEGMIADSLDEYGIAYRYAPQTMINGRVVYPDFECLNASNGKVFYWEHNGMMTAEGYSHHFTRKMNLYEKAEIIPGENLIVTFEDDKFPLNYPTIRRMIERYLV